MTLLQAYVVLGLPAIALLAAYAALKLTEADGREARRMAEEEREGAAGQPSA